MRKYDTYLIYINNFNIKSPSLDSISTVHEFPDIFPIDLLGIAFASDIEFVIDLEPGSQPIFKEPYRMATTKVKKLNSQLYDFLRVLLDRVFILGELLYSL